MSKKHFIELADLIREDGSFTEGQIAALAQFCQRQNYAFNRQRWLAYIAGDCGPSGGAIKQPKREAALA